MDREGVKEFIFGLSRILYFFGFTVQPVGS